MSNRNWKEEKKDYFYHIKRVFTYYKSQDKEISIKLNVNKSFVKYLEHSILRIPAFAWDGYRKKLISYNQRKAIYERGINVRSIEKKEGLTIESFTPNLWLIISKDSGYLKGFDNKCYVVGYNTPLKTKDDFNYRCLAIYEKIDNKFFLRKQTFNALEDFVDNEDDLLFDGFNETDFTVGIKNGNIEVNYEYMRGDSYYHFFNNEWNWFLGDFGFSHRTCCEAEVYSYNYNKKEYSYSVYATSSDEAKDTTIVKTWILPKIFMDSLNVRRFDYSITGLLMK